MGWAKYFEDNVEIVCERRVTMQSYRKQRDIKIVCTTVLPATKIAVDIKEEYTTPSRIKYENRYITCKECGQKFLFSAIAQQYFEKMDWEAPKRCKYCRNYRNTRYLMYPSF